MHMNQKLFEMDNTKLYVYSIEKKELNMHIHLICNLFPEDIHVGIVNAKNITDPKLLFEKFSQTFAYPEYFGSNWDAFDECVNDLDWIQRSAYILFIENMDLLKIPENDYEIFVRILSKTTVEWSQGRSFGAASTPPKPFVVILCESPGDHSILAEKLSNYENVKFDFFDMNLLVSE
jgi:RNAse (barnase) inhibitor barstar